MRTATEWVRPFKGATLAKLRLLIGQAAMDRDDEITVTDLAIVDGGLIDPVDHDRVRQVLALPEVHQQALHQTKVGPVGTPTSGTWVPVCDTCSWAGHRVLSVLQAEREAFEHRAREASSAERAA